jgi:ATP-dependent RNA helicase DBP3
MGRERDTSPEPAKKKVKRDAGSIEEARESIGVVVHGDKDNEFPPLLEFAKAPFPKALLDGMCGTFTKPSPVQAQCWPVVASGKDVVGIASTGSGKTLAFAMPGLSRRMEAGAKLSKGSPSTLVLAPTRELALQIHEVYVKATQFSGIRAACVFGGMSKSEQRIEIAKSDVIIATPGRLLDFMEEGCIKLKKVNYLVLDEADRMLDMGFEKDVRRIISETASSRQTVMFSATWPQSIQALAQDFMNTPITVTVGSTNLAASHTITQIVEIIAPEKKMVRLRELLKKYHKNKERVLVFCLYKKEAARVEAMLSGEGWPAIGIHGDLSQQQRIAALDAFKSASKPILVATDVAARGLDIANVEAVINVTFPLTIEDYVHRIGRTGRAGKSGISHTLFTVEDKGHAGELVNILREANQEVPEALTNFGCGVKRKEHKMYGNHFKADDERPMAKKSHMTFGDDE